jgi:hypothetical protein
MLGWVILGMHFLQILAMTGYLLRKPMIRNPFYRIALPVLLSANVVAIPLVLYLEHNLYSLVARTMNSVYAMVYLYCFLLLETEILFLFRVYAQGITGKRIGVVRVGLTCAFVSVAILHVVYYSHEPDTKSLMGSIARISRILLVLLCILIHLGTNTIWIVLVIRSMERNLSPLLNASMTVLGASILQFLVYFLFERAEYEDPLKIVYLHLSCWMNGIVTIVTILLFRRVVEESTRKRGPRVKDPTATGTVQ